jgi:hypothetical protein
MGEWPGNRSCCTIVVFPGESIQDAIDSLPPAGGCVCLKSGVHEITHSLVINKSNVMLHGEAPGTRVVLTEPSGMLGIVGTASDIVENVEVAHITFDYSVFFEPPDGPAIIGIGSCRGVRILHCELLYTAKTEKMLIIGIQVIKSTDVAIVDNRFDRMFQGVRVPDEAGALLIADNTIRGQLIETEFGTGPWAWMGVFIGPRADGIVRGNVIENFDRAVVMVGTHGEILDNHIRMYPLPAGLDTATDIHGVSYAIRAQTRQPGRVQGNTIELASKSHGGVDVASNQCTVTDNTIKSTYGTPTLIGPVGVSVHVLTERPGAGRFTLVGRNLFTGTQIAIYGAEQDFVQITDNRIDGGGDGKEAPLGIWLDGCVDCSVTDNDMRHVALPFWLTNGNRNRVVGNSATSGRIATFLDREGSIELHNNTFEDMSQLGIGCRNLRGTPRFTDLRVQGCAYDNPTAAMSLVIVQEDLKQAVDVAIQGCDILDTGVSDAGAFTPGVAYGVVTLFVSHLEITDNRIRHPVETPLPQTAEHRALKLIGMPAISLEGGHGREYATGAVLVSGNEFQGPSASRLVDLRRLSITPIVDLRFEKMTFSVNRCDHFGRPGPANITADLYGSHMIVTSNQVKTPVKGHSFGFGGRLKVAATSNYTTGDWVNVGSTIPAVFPNFNAFV